MDDFLKQFRDKLNRRPEPDFELNDWLDLQKHLDQRPTKRRVIPVFWWWVLAPVLTLSLATNGVLFKKLQQVKQDAKGLTVGKDTVYVTQLVYQTDTIIQTKIVWESIPRSQAFILTSDLTQKGQRTVVPLSESRVENGANTHLTGKNLDFTQPNYNTAPQTDSATASESVQTSRDWRHLPLLEMRLSPLTSETGLPAITGFELPLAERNTRRKGRFIIPAIRPKDFSLGVSGGLVYPLNTGLNKQHGWSLGLQASIGITPRWRIWLEEQYIRTGFLSEYMGDDIGVPVVTPPSNDFVFVNAETRQPMWQTGLGVQYGFNPQKTWRPFLGAGYGIVSVAPYEVTYEFKNQVLNTEWDYDQEVRHRELLNGFLLLRAGIERRVAGPFNMNLSATYRTNFDKNTFSTPPLWGIQLGLRF